MPLANIVDHRSNKYCIKVDAVFEPSWHDNSIKDKHKTTTQFPIPETDEFHCEDLNKTTVVEAIEYANRWEQPVTLYLYDYGSYPIVKPSKVSK